MTVRITGGPPASPADRARARGIRALLAGELDRIRARALAWRNGLGALLAGLIGFSLIKGRADVTQLRPSYAVAVGVLLLFALIAGGAAATLLIRAAHGGPYGTLVDRTTGSDPLEAARRTETESSLMSLRWGVPLFFACAMLLIIAVGLTWYGPEKDKPRIDLHLTSGGHVCGEIVELSGGRLTLKTDQGRTTVDVSEANGMSAVDTCEARAPS